MNHLERLEALETDRESARSEFDRAMLAKFRLENRLDSLSIEIETLDIEIRMEAANLAFELRRERDAKYQPIQRGKLLRLELVG